MATPCMPCAVQRGDCVFKPDLGHDFVFMGPNLFHHTFKATF